MEFATDLMSALRNRTSSDGSSGAAAGYGALLDWSGLHARLSSAHALRQELGISDSRRILLDGGFSDWSLCTCDEPKSALRVNLKDSTDRKGPQGMEADIAGLIHASDREQ